MKKVKESKIKLVITGGHLTPAIAVIEKLLKEKNCWEILFLGRKTSQEGSSIPSLEINKIPNLGIHLKTIPAGKIPRHLNRWTFISLIRIPLGFLAAFYHIKKFKPDVILTFGGYLAIPVSISGWLTGIPIVTHEQTTTKGLSHSLIEKIATYTAISWEESRKHFKGKVIVTGNPIREAIIKGQEKKVPIKRDKRTLYITGGNQGSHVINLTVAKAIKDLTERYSIIHQCGTGEAGRDYDFLLHKRGALNKSQKHRYLVKRWFNEQEVAWILNNSSLIISRAGANTMAELAHTAKPALLIPLPISGRNEQLANASLLQKAGSAEILTQKELSSDNLIKSINNMIKNLPKYEKKAQILKHSIPQNGAEAVIELVKTAYEEKKKNKNEK